MFSFLGNFLLLEILLIFYLHTRQFSYTHKFYLFTELWFDKAITHDEAAIDVSPLNQYLLLVLNTLSLIVEILSLIYVTEIVYNYFRNHMIYNTYRL